MRTRRTRGEGPLRGGRARPGPHGRLLAAEVGELAGVSGTTIGQWARRGYIRSSQSTEEPRVYSVEDVGEAAIVSELLARGVSRGEVRAAIELLREQGPWPLSEARLATTEGEGRTRLVMCIDRERLVLGPHGWQAVIPRPSVREVRLRLRRRYSPSK